MHTQLTRQFLISAMMVGVFGSVGGSSRLIAQTQGTPEKYNATAVNMGSGPGIAGRVLITVERWTTPAEREALLKTFIEKGPNKLLDAVEDSKKVGYLRFPTTIGWDLRYAFETPLPEGGRRVVLITDRPMNMQELQNGSRTVDYPFTLIEIHFDKQGAGVGKMSLYTQIVLSKDKKSIELENFGIEPVRLTDVRIEKP